MARRPLFLDRRDAGRQLAAQLGEYAGRDDVVVVALPRGGVPVAAEVALAVGAPLDVCVVSKIGFPGHEELAIGAVASGEIRVLNREILRRYDVPDVVIAAATERALAQLRSHEREMRGSRPAISLADRVVIVVDDGLATGMTMRAAVLALRAQRLAELVVAVPVAPPEVVESLASDADVIVCGRTPQPFEAVGTWYLDFGQVGTDTVRRLLDHRAERA